ncbi:MAG: UvrD-helicase domain-containing protein [Ruminococcaceae bacterium]|nr:UvrD-helicase domain-containing protein [Oscillospiraceae bacterium]
MTMNNDIKKSFIKARRKKIGDTFPNLNTIQKDAVLTTSGPLLILAGAGSGKTTVLTNRIANLIRFGTASDSDTIPEHISKEEMLAFVDGDAECSDKICAVSPVPPWRIIAITFTNKAADELKNRLQSLVGEQAEDIWARTFHSACVRILRRFADRLGYPNSFTIYDSQDRLSVMKSIIRELDLNDKTFVPKVLLAKLDAARDELLSPQDFKERYNSSGDPRERKLCEIYEIYADRLFKAGAMDFEDLLYNTIRLFKEHPDVLSLYQKQFLYVLIDEYQDTNNLQYMLASMLAEGHGNICVVGDDDQSIYKFRGATIENILNFENQFKGCKTIRLEQNYRSSGHVLAAANAVISNNRGRKGKTLWTTAEEGEKLLHYVAQNEDDEAQFVANKILENYEDGGKFSDNAILYRMNAQSNRLEFAMKRNGIPYKVYGGTKFYDRAEIKDVLAYLSVILSPADDLRVLRIINKPARGIGKTAVERCVEVAAAEGKPLFEVLKNSYTYDELRKFSSKIIPFTDMIIELIELSATLPLDRLFEELLDKSGYARSLLETNTVENKSRYENVNELLTNIQSYMTNSEEPSLFGFLDEVALYTDLDSYDESSDCAVMMTMHSAKGLEYDNVFVVGVEESIFPGLASIGDTAEMEEERRLCYVAITRAKKKLVLTSARQRMLFGRTTSNMPSRFTEEIPSENIERGGYLPPRQKIEEFAAARSFRREGYKGPAATNLNASSGEIAKYSAGDKVVHRVFGSGVIASLKPVGGDALLEIIFDTAGKKLLMLKTAAVYMSKE